MYKPPVWTVSKYTFFIYTFRLILTVNRIISLNGINRFIFVMEKCFLWGTNWIFNYYLDEVRLQSVNTTPEQSVSRRT
jgi:hypothetical protein